MRGWRLEVLLRLRRRGKEAARRTLGEALAEEARRRARRDACALALEAHAGRRESARGNLVAAASGGAAELLSRARFVERLRGEVAVLREAVLAAEADLASAAADAARRQGAFARAQRWVRALESLREQWESERRRERERREEIEAGDRVSARAAGRWPGPARTRS